MTEFERKLLDILRNFHFQDIDALMRRVIEIEQRCHERIDKMNERLKDFEQSGCKKE